MTTKRKTASLKKTIYLSTFLLLISTIILFFNFEKSGSKPAEEKTNKSNFPKILMTESGKPMFASGNCLSDSDCILTGCSEQICANHEVVTTCEYVEIPEKETYSCGCINNVCVWHR